MKVCFLVTGFMLMSSASSNLLAQATKKDSLAKVTRGKNLYLDVHHLGAGKVDAKGVAQAHAKDLVTQGKYGVNFLKYWVDEKEGIVMCLAEAKDSASLSQSHKEAHGLVPDRVYSVTDGEEAKLIGDKNLYLDVHHIGAGKVTAKDVAAAHQKDLAVEKKYGVNFVNYWLNEKEGVVMCLAEAKDSAALVNTHKEAHGLVPDRVMKVKQGQ